MKTSLKLILGFLFLVNAQGFSASFVFGESIDVDDPKELVYLILENKEYCTEGIVNEKIYLNPKQIYPTDQGAFLRINRFDLVLLPCIYSAAEGCYIDLKTIQK